MKHCTCLLLLLAPFSPIALALQPNLPDVIYKHQLEFCSPENIDADSIWDFSKISIFSKSYPVETFFTDSVQDMFWQQEHNARYYYSFSADTLYCNGYEDANVEITYANSLPRTVWHLQVGESFSMPFRGNGVYGHLLPMQLVGTYRYEVVAKGLLKLPELKAKPATCHHTRQEYHVSGVDDTRLVEDRYSWYGTNDQPILESILSVAYPVSEDGTLYSDTIVRTSLLYNAEDSYDDVYDKDAEKDFDDMPEVERIFANAHFLPNPVVTDLQISYSLMRDANVGYSIHNASGMPIVVRNAKFTEAGEHTDVLPMSGCMKGGYTLYIFVDEYIIQKVIIKI